MKIHRKLLVELIEGADAPWTKSRVLSSSCLPKDCREGHTEEDIDRALDHHESLIALQIIDEVGEAIVWLHLWHLEASQNGLI